MPSKPYATSYAGDLSFWRSRSKRTWAIVLIGLVLAGPYLLSELHVVLASTLFITLIGAVAMNMLMGVAGILSLGAAAFLVTGAFVATTLAFDLHLPFGLVVLGAGLAAALVGAVVALFTARLHGLYVVMVTFALHFVALFVAGQYQTAMVGSAGFLMPNVEFGPWSSSSDSFWYYLTFALAALAVVASANLLRTNVGRSWVAMRDRELVAEAMGINLFRTKIVAFAATSFLFGIAGAVNAYFVGYIGSESYDIHIAIQYVAIIIVGGTGRLLGSVIGAMFVVLLPYVVRWFVRGGMGISFEDVLGDQVFEVQAAVYGVAIVLFMLVEPGGIAALWTNRLKRYFVLWPFRRRLDLG